MLQLLISILMAFGLTYDANSGKIKVTQDVVTKAQTISNYNDDVVITQQVDPTAKQ